MDTNILIVSADPASRIELGDLVENAGDVAITCAGPGVDHCPGLATDSCALTSAADAVVIDVTSVTHVAALQAHYTAHGVPVVGVSTAAGSPELLEALEQVLAPEEPNVEGLERAEA